MSETQGRGEMTDESRIERNNKRPLENTITDDVRDAVATTLTGNTMSDATSFSAQVALLEELKTYLGTFQDRLQGVSNNYQERVDQLHQAGMMNETYQRYVENELAQTQAMISRLVEHIGSSDIPKVSKEIDYLSQKT